MTALHYHRLTVAGMVSNMNVARTHQFQDMVICTAHQLSETSAVVASPASSKSAFQRELEEDELY